MIDVTIVIASYETRALLLACLESIEVARRSHPKISVETIVVDNGSSDGSAVAVRERFPEVRLVALARNRGFAAAVNRGIERSEGRAVLLLNSDVEIDQDLIADGLRLLDQHPDIAVLGGSLAHPDGRRQRSVHPLPGLQTECLPEFVVRLLRPDGFSTDVPSKASSSAPRWRAVEAVRGAVFLLRASVVAEIGPFDEGFFFFLEETDYCARVRAAGYRVVFAEEMRAVHHLGASSKRRAPLATRIEFHRSLYRYLEIHRGPWTARIAVIVRTLRGAALVVAMLAAYCFSSRVRRRLPERWGTWLWHLRGRPAEPSLAEVLDAS